MKPISNAGNNIPTSANCIKTPSTCVIWNGPDIPCIKVCHGDTIDVIVYQLATLLCDITENVLDVTTLDFECLVGSGDCPPETLLETLQLIITKVCNPDPSPDPCPPDSGLPIVQLPPCLYYTNSENDQVTALPLDQYAQYLASTICQIIADINSINATLTSINNRLTVLELSGSGGSGGGTPISTIIAGCYSGTPGTPVTIPTALVNLESKICEYNTLLGTLTEWNDFINSTCITGTTPLPCGTGTYGSIPGWITNVETAADSLKNLWIAVCKLNECLSAAPPAEACATIPPTNLTVAAVTNTTCTLNWTAPVTIGLTPPSGYKIQIFNAAGTGSAIANYTIPGNVTSYVLPTPTLSVDTQYTVKVIAVYGCGDSQGASIVAVLKAPLYLAKIYYNNTVLSSSPQICTPSSGPASAYNLVTNELKIELKDTSGNPLANANIQALKVIVRIQTIGCGGAVTNANQTILIAPGATFGTVTFVAQEKILCGSNCEDIVRSVECYVSATLNDGSPLPSTIGLDTTLTSLGTC